MSEIRKIICGILPRTMPNGRVIAADYFELTVRGSSAKLVQYQNGKQKTTNITDAVFLETALEMVEELLAEHPDEQPPSEYNPFAYNVFFADGSVKYAPREELSSILCKLASPALPDYLMPQGLIAAQPPISQMPMLQGIVPANPLRSAPQKSAGSVWKCRCGAKNTGKFCENCGSPKP